MARAVSVPGAAGISFKSALAASGFPRGPRFAWFAAKLDPLVDGIIAREEDWGVMISSVEMTAREGASME